MREEKGGISHPLWRLEEEEKGKEEPVSSESLYSKGGAGDKKHSSQLKTSRRKEALYFDP